MGAEERSTPGSGSPSAKFGKDAAARPRNWLVPATLLALREANSYGYELIEQMVRLEFGTMTPGTLYRTLRHMEKNGLCRSEWNTSNGRGPARRVYIITDAGEAYLDFWAMALEQYRRNLDSFFRVYWGLSATNDHEEEKKDRGPRQSPGGIQGTR